MMDNSYSVGYAGFYRLFQNGKKLLSMSLLPLFVLLALFSGQEGFAQGAAITGKVTDAGGIGLPGVTVQVKGMTRGTSTDGDGTFRLADVSGGATLVFSSIGYTTQEVAIGNRSSVTVSLAEDAKSLSEVVVVGYGTQKAKDATGGVVALGVKDFNKGVITSPEQLLQGRAAGIQVTPASGEPGAGINIQIRGTSSIRSNNNPLYVIDGVPLSGDDVSSGGFDLGAGSSSARNPLSFLNPSDIENISVLKDASAAAIYGARGSNGVVLITTKRGKSGQQTLNFSTNASVSSAARTYDLLSAAAFKAGLVKSGGTLDKTTDGGANTNWQDAILQTAVTHNQNLSFGGGNDNTRYFFSLGYQDQQGVIKTSGLQRTTARVNASHELFKDKVVLDLNLTTSGIQNRYVPNGDNAGYQGSIIGAALQANPTYPINGGFLGNAANETGGYFTPGGDFRNPVAILNLYNDRDNVSRTLGSLSATWRITDGLSAKVNFGIDNAASTRWTNIDKRLSGFNDTYSSSPGKDAAGNVISSAGVPGGRAVIQNRANASRLIEYTLSYNKRVGVGTLDVLGGFSYQKFTRNSSFVDVKRFTVNTDQFLYTDNLGAVENNGAAKAYSGGSDAGQNELQSYFGRANYNIQDKYLLTATVRVDGSSKFGINNKYGTFPSLAAAWRLSNESFIPKSIFSDLKLRASWGITGNQEFPGGVSRILFQANADGSQTQQNNPNPNIKWEQTTQFSGGVDFSILNGRLSGSVDYFNKAASDQLFQVVYPQPTNATYKWVNLPGIIRNTGVETSLIFQAVQTPKFGWEVNYNMTFLKNNVESLGGNIIPTGNINGQGLSGAYAQTIRAGSPIYSFYLPTFAGYDDQGNAIYPNDAAFALQGSPIPTFTAGLTNNFTFGKFNASIFLNAATGFKIYNNTANALFTKGALKNGRNVTVAAANSTEGTLNAPEVSTAFLEKGDFLRVSNASLSYQFALPQGGFAKNLQVSLTGQNLLLITSYSGIDPEVNTNKSRDGVPSRGIDYAAFPTARTFTLGLNVGF